MSNAILNTDWDWTQGIMLCAYICGRSLTGMAYHCPTMAFAVAPHWLQICQYVQAWWAETKRRRENASICVRINQSLPRCSTSLAYLIKTKNTIVGNHKQKRRTDLTLHRYFMLTKTTSKAAMACALSRLAFVTANVIFRIQLYAATGEEVSLFAPLGIV